MDQFGYTIVTHLGTVGLRSGSYTLELNKVRWRDGEAKADLRLWVDFSDAERRKPLKGLTLTAAEVNELKRILNESEE